MLPGATVSFSQSVAWLDPSTAMCVRFGAAIVTP